MKASRHGLNRGIQENAIYLCEICHSLSINANLLNYCCLIRPFEMESKFPDWIVVFHNKAMVSE